MTAEQLCHISYPDKCTELVRGKLVVREPAGYRHGRVVARLTKVLADHVDANELGEILGAETGFTIFRDPDTVRAPNVGFVRRERVPVPVPTGYAELAPDLVVEVLSPDDRPGQVLAKVGDWLEAGVQLVWVVDPQRRKAHIHRADGSTAVIDDVDMLEGEDAVPGFVCRLDTIL
ncbi:MAG: Uma2 family endonuclease [Gemmatimonadetes bacterium]|nr:Uma2 family endonuclease [Gemmatimonadota bacterium]